MTENKYVNISIGPTSNRSEIGSPRLLQFAPHNHIRLGLGLGTGLVGLALGIGLDLGLACVYRV